MTDMDTTPPESSGEPGVAPPGESEVDSREAPPTSFLVFPVSGYGLLLDQQGALEYLESEAPYHIPNNHPVFRGLVNRRGNLVPVYDIRGLLNARTGTQEESRLLVLGSGDEAVGIVLDGVPYRVNITEEEKAPAPPELTRVFGGHLGDCYVRNMDTFALVALDDFLYELANDPGN